VPSQPPASPPQPSSAAGLTAAPESAPAVLVPSPLPSPGTAQENLRELRATPTAKGGPGDPASVVAGPGGFALASHDRQWQIRFRALVQADGRFWFDDVQRPQIDTFLLRRVQPTFEGSLPYGISFLVNPDFGGGTTVLQDAYLGVEIGSWLRFRFGKYRPPFGLERLQPTSNLSFVEFGLPTLLTPNRDVGAMAYGDLFKGVFGYAAGVFNGVADNASGDLDNDSEKEFAGRAYLRPFLLVPNEVLGRLFVGVATTFGRVYGSPANTALTNPTSTPAYKTPGQNTDFSYITAATGVTPDTTNTVIANGPHNRYGVYLYEALGPLGLLGEYYLSDQEVGRAGFPNTWVHNRAYQAQATFVLFGADASYDFVHVKTPVEPAAGHFGALELAARVGHLDIDSDVFPNFASPTGSVRGATEVTLGANWYWSDNAKFVVNWDHTEFQGGAKTAPEVAIGHREAENILLLRAQVVY
jgi:phosphate-selective porin OprO/OprP